MAGNEVETVTALDSPEAGERILFLHLPKTAGSALRNLFARHLGEAKVSNGLNMRLEDALVRYEDMAAICGHFHAECGLVLPADRLSITVLRDPVDRFLSYFYFRKFDAAGHMVDQRVLSHDVEQFIDDQEEADTADLNLQTQMLYPLGTGIVTRLSWIDRVAAAKCALDRIDLVGVHDEIDDFVCMIRARMGWPQDSILERLNVTSQRITADQLSAPARRKLEDVLQFDRAVFEHAVARFRSGRRASIQGAARRPIPVIGDVPTRLVAAAPSPQPRELGDRRIELDSVRISGELSGDSVALIGERVTISIDCTAHEPLEQVSAGFVIRDDRGLPAFGTDTHMLGDVHALAPGKYRFNFSFMNRLQGGAYTLDVKLLRNGTPVEGCHHWKERAARFDVHGWAAVPFVGSVMMDVSSGVDGISAEARVETGPARAAGPPVASCSGRLNPPLTDYSARIDVLTRLPVLPTGGEFLVDMELENTGVDTWRATGRRPVSVSYHWHGRDGSIIENDGLRTLLPRDVRPGERIRVVGLLRAPQRSGNMHLIWTLVQEEIGWFDMNDEGSRCVVDVTVSTG